VGTKYSSQATSGYNSSPPPDDGTQVASNLVTWAGVKTKLADVLKTFGEAINTALVSALDLSARSISSNDTAIASDHWKTLQVTGTTTIQLSSAASMAAGYEVQVFNAGTGVVTVNPAGSDTINGLSVGVTVSIKGSKVFRTNQALTGYNVVGGFDPQTGAFTTSVVTPLVDSGTGSLIFQVALNASNQWLMNTVGVLFPISDNVAEIGKTTNRIKTIYTPNVQFPATQVTSADANCLDDYEEGTWTPSLGGTTTYTAQLGTYTKIGRMVTIMIVLQINAIGTGSTTVISGLPFAAGASQDFVFPVQAETSATNIVSAVGVLTTGNSTISIVSRTAASASNGANAIFQNATVVRISGNYMV